MKKILIILDNFSPDLGAASFRFEGIVKELADRGNIVTVLSSYPNRINKEKIKDMEFKYKNVSVVRMKEKRRGKNIFQTAMAYFLFFLDSLKDGIKLARASDIIISSSPQLFVGFSGAIISLITKKKFILDIRDLWPDIIIDMGIMKKYNPIYQILKLLELVMYKSSDHIVYNSPKFKEYLSTKIAQEKMSLITNGIDDYILEYFKEHQNNIKLKKKYKIIYAGNLGIAQDIIILVDFAKLYQDNIEILLIGKGSQENDIREKIIKENLSNIKIISAIPREELLIKYKEADFLYLQLKNIKMFEKTIPSKIFEYLATKKPIIYGIEGVGKEILQEKFAAKYYYEANNLKKLVITYEKLLKDIEEEKYIEPNITELENHYSRKKLSEKFVEIIEKVI